MIISFNHVIDNLMRMLYGDLNVWMKLLSMFMFLLTYGPMVTLAPFKKVLLSLSYIKLLRSP